MFGFQTVGQGPDPRVRGPGLDRLRRRDKIQVVIACAEKIPLGRVDVCDLGGVDCGSLLLNRHGVNGFNDRLSPSAGGEDPNHANQKRL